MLFCPTCGNILLIEKGSGSFRYFCKTCPYVFNVNQTIKKIKRFEEKDDDFVIGGKEEWANAATVSGVTCASGKCDNDTAYYQEIQIRSADEPMTQKYKCTKCGYVWLVN